MAGRLTGNNLVKRDNEMVQARLQGLTYKELSKKFGISTAGVSYVLTKPDIKTMIEGGTADTVATSRTLINISTYLDIIPQCGTI
jgi:hypothetical protein